jgi:hypothetical protein
MIILKAIDHQKVNEFLPPFTMAVFPVLFALLRGKIEITYGFGIGGHVS